MKDDVLELPDWTARRYFWTPERERQLRTMLTYHDMSCAEMARALGVTKNAICGKTSRMGLSIPRPDVDPGSSRGRWLARRREQARARAIARKMGPPEKPPRPLWKPRRVRAEPAQAVSGVPVALVDLTDKTCRWPLWDNHATGDKMFCGAMVVDGSVYCLTHYKLAKPPKGGER
jgi:GcrA cell cycle regulator